jgi:predicted DNA-binding transcriptional regulator AlpA
MGDRDTLLTPEVLAEYLGVPVGVLANWRYMGTGPRFIKLGAKTVRYRESEVEDWLNKQTRAQT